MPSLCNPTVLPCLPADGSRHILKLQRRGCSGTDFHASGPGGSTLLHEKSKHGGYPPSHRQPGKLREKENRRLHLGMSECSYVEVVADNSKRKESKLWRRSRKRDRTTLHLKPPFLSESCESCVAQLMVKHDMHNPKPESGDSRSFGSLGVIGRASRASRKV